jgi:hypothetical protein
MSAIFQRPLCDMGKAFEYSFRPLVGEPDPGSGGGCDERPHRVELYSAATDPRSATPEWRPFGLCAEHESQLRSYDGRLPSRGLPSRFRVPAAAGRTAT